MIGPLPNIQIDFTVEDFGVNISGSGGASRYSGLTSVTNYDYEVQKNEGKRTILILKPEFLGVFISDLKNVMKYDKSSQFEDSTTKKV